MKVYVVGLGERGEGHDARAVFRSLSEAKQYIAKVWGVTLNIRQPRDVGFWMGTLNGTDEVTVTRLELRAADMTPDE